MRVVMLCLALFIVGCETTKTSIVSVDDVQQHPPMPKTIFCSQLTNDSIQSNGSHQVIKPDAVFTIGDCNEEIIRYVLDAEVTLCYYREKLNESRCEPYREAIKALRTSSKEM